MKLSKSELAALQCIHEGKNSICYLKDTSAYGIPVIIKLSRHGYQAPRQIVQFANEYALTRDLNIPGIRKAYYTGTIDGRAAVILNYVKGKTIKQAFVDQRKLLPQVLKTAIAIAQVLGKIHRHHIIHKNINSHHILVNSDSQKATIIDFGIASKVDLKMRHLGIPEVLEGTLAYISPEQTGRMNRTVDYRTDFYSLGVVLYEMLTGRLPFVATDASELVHHHIARRPEPVCEVNLSIPEVVSGIVMKLMSKNAEDRYQSSFGLVADLENCLNQLVEKDTIHDFALAGEDFSERLEIPQKLYGREQETQILIQAFERVAGGARKIVLVSGSAGVGKSCLVHELDRFVAENEGYFISVGCDQYQRNIPYDALVRAFTALVNVMLTEKEKSLAVWKATILEAIGGNGQVLIDVIPSLEWIIGRQPSIKKLSPAEGQQRFFHVSRDFLQAVVQKEHPLVFFIDDLQWMDATSLDVFYLLMTDPNNHHLLFIGAYRDDQIDKSHPLMQIVKDIERKALVMKKVRLKNLSYDAVSLLLSDTLRCEPSEAKPLMDFVYEKTGGNAFFIAELLQSLYGERLLTFCFEKRRWDWDISQIRDKAVTDDVATLIINKIKILPETTREMLMLATCIGNTFTMNTVAAIAVQPAKTIFDHLWTAVEEGLVLPLDDNYIIMLAKTEDQPPAMDCQFEFANNRVRQVIYSLMPTRVKRSVHLAAGRLRLQELEKDEIEEYVFDIVDHLNKGFKYIQDEQEKMMLADLNLIAGRKAKNFAAYQSAIWYLSMGVGLLPPNKWERYYNLASDLYMEAAEAEYLSANFERAKLLAEEVLHQARDIKDKIKVYNFLIPAYKAQNLNVEATEAALAVLETLGGYSPPIELEAKIDSVTETPALLDVAAVIKASHMLSQEIRLEKLLDKMINIVIENAGAEKGILIMKKNGRLVIQAVGRVGQHPVETMLATPVEESGEVSLSVVNYVARTQTPVVLQDASRNSIYAADHYIAQHQIRSLLCLPIIYQAELLGLVYLENNLVTNVFTPDRLELLKTLSSQAAISMQNANLYASLEENIRELKQTEKALKNSEQRLADIISFLPDATFAIDLDGKVILWNRAAEEFTGVPAKEILGKGDYKHAIPFYGDRRPILIDLLLKPKPEVECLYPTIKRVGKTIFGESYTKSARRGEVYLAGVATPLYDSEGKVMGAIETIRDITDRKKMEEALTAQEREFRTLAENSPDNIARYDTNCRTLYVNPTLEQTLGSPMSEMLGTTPVEANIISEAKEYQKKIAKVFKTGKADEMDLTLQDSKAGVHYHNIRFVPERGAEGSITGVQAIGRDITEAKHAEEELKKHRDHLEELVQKRTAELEAANKELESFAYSVSHDLRAPLRHIDGFMELLKKKAGAVLDEKSRHFMDNISDSVNKMGLLIDNLLSFSRMGRQEMSSQTVDLRKLVKDVIREFEPDTVERTVDWRIGDLPVVRGDSAMLRVVMDNLISNALKFTRLRHEAQIKIGSQPVRDGEIMIYIRDNGVGFDMAYADKLFGVFQRLHRSDEFDGTGIGLANVRRIIARHGGKTWAEGKPDRGATFFFSLPYLFQSGQDKKF